MPFCASELKCELAFWIPYRLLHLLMFSYRNPKFPKPSCSFSASFAVSLLQRRTSPLRWRLWHISSVRAIADPFRSLQVLLRSNSPNYWCWLSRVWFSMFAVLEKATTMRWIGIFYFNLVIKWSCVIMIQNLVDNLSLEPNLSFI